MTIEFSLRRRATLARWFSAIYITLAVLILVGAYFTFPSLAGTTLRSVNEIEGSSGGTLEKGSFLHLHILAAIILVLSLSAVSFASYLLARCAFVEIDLAARSIGLADALCIAGDDFERLEKAADLLVPPTKYFPEVAEKNLQTLLDLAKAVRGKE